MKRRLLWAAGLAAIVTLAAAYWMFARPWYRITISKETTFITEPLRADGYVDYEAALNELASKGVTRENNAAVLLAQAFDPYEIGEQIRERFFRMLGVSPLVGKGKYFEWFQHFYDRTAPEQGVAGSGASGRDRSEEARDQIEEAMTRPWTEREFPVLGQWLGENEKHLRLVVAASQRARYYVPRLCPPNSATLDAFCSVPHDLQAAARGLSARAMLRVKVGKLEEAWQDLLACHRLARLAAQGTQAWDAILGRSIEVMTCSCDAALAHWANLTPQQAVRFARDLRNLPPMDPLADKVNIGERFMYLDSVAGTARGDINEDGWPGRGAREPKGLFDGIVDYSRRMSVNWDEALRRINVHFDRFFRALSKPTRRERRAAFNEVAREVEALVKEQHGPTGILRILQPAEVRATAAGRRIGLIIVGLQLASLSRAEEIEGRADVQQRMAQVAFALAAFRAEQGTYPAKLADLVPKYLKELPEDVVSGKPLRYKREGTGYLLYSLGPNEKDDNGRESPVTDPKTGEELRGDDIVIRMPAPKKTDQ